MPPLDEEQRRLNVLWLARLERSARRKVAHEWFEEVGLPVRLICSGLYGTRRDRLIAGSKICLAIFGDRVMYCDQVRLFTTWAAGSVIVSEPCEHYAAFGIRDGVHLVTAALGRFPEVCRDLLARPEERARIARASQDLLLERYTTPRWLSTMVDIIRSV
jgi:hypothetical protein